MTEYISPYRIANAILQDNAFNGIYLLVEGSNDYILYRRFINSDLCEVQIAFGKQNIIDAIQILKERGYTDVIGFLDSDFRNLEQQPDDNDQIFYTDNHDIESTIIESNAFNVLIDTYCDVERLENFVKESNADDLKTILSGLVAPLGYLKWANIKEGWGLIFKPKDKDGPELKMENFITPATLKFNGYEEMIRTVFNYSRGKVKVIVKEDVTLKYVKSLSESKVDHYQLCNGYDLCYLFALGLRKKLANFNSKAPSADQIETNLIHCYESRFFQETNLYRNIKNWETATEKEILSF